MTLREWLKTADITHDEFARRMTARGIPTSTPAVGKWVRGERTPRRDAIQAIAAETDQAVPPASWFPDARAAE